MSDFRDEFIELAVSSEVLRFGEFTLKSGRISPYFFNAGLFNTGARLARLGRFYADAIVASGVSYDMLFGPAYKGITLVAASAIALAQGYDLDVPWCFNRKEIKDHGEGGQLIGAPLAGRVLLVDDVITAGTAIGEAVAIIRAQGAEPAGVIIAIDRQERVESGRSAVQTVTETLGVPVVSIATLDHILNYLDARPELIEVRRRIDGYRDRYGVGN